ncbi:MAG TPA: DUF3667 domain-containing protein [Chryseosolibacter sp.]
MTTCANCNGQVETNFCPTCGQKNHLHRITFGHVVHEGLHSITHADKGFLLLVKSLLTRPGFVAKEYIEGKRKRYFNPLSFLVISSALFAYFGSITGFMDALTGGGTARTGGRPISEEWREAYRIAATSGKWLTLLLIAPLFSLLSWLFFIRKKYNYAENFVLHAFIFGEAVLFRLLVFIPLFLIVPEKTSILNLVVYEAFFLLFLTVAYKQFFNQHILLIVTKVILIRALFVVLFWGLIYGYVIVKPLVL